MRQWWSRVKQWRGSYPSASHRYDVALLRQLRGRVWPKWRQLRYFSRVLTSLEKKLFRVSILTLLVGLVWLGMAIVARYRDEAPAVGGRYVEAVVGAPQLINPVFAGANEVDADIVRLVYAGLMRYNEEQILGPDLADRYEISEDKKVYTFYLRDNVRWHDGEPLTARDVVFTFETIQNPAVGSPLLVSFQGLKVEAADEKTVRFTLPQPFAPFLSSLTVGILPEHIWFGISPERLRLAQSNLQPIGTGPFKFKKLTKDETGYIYSYELERFDGYFGQPAFLKEFVWQFFGDYDGQDGAIQAIREQRVDGLHFVPSDLKDKVARKHIRLRTVQLPQFTALFFNQEKLPLLKDKEIRTALVYAVDRERVVREAVRGAAELIDSPILPGFPGYDASLSKMFYDVSQANALLDKKWSRISAADYREIKKGKLLKELENQAPAPTSTSVITTTREEAEREIDATLNDEISPAQTFYRQNKEGAILELTLVTAETPEYKQAAELMAGFWQEIGVKTKLRLVSPRDLSREVLRTRAYDVLLYGEIIGSDPDQYPFWHSSQIDFPGLNLARYVNRSADALLEKARTSITDQETVDLYKKFQTLLLSDLPAVFLYTPTYTYATSEKVRGIDITRIFVPADRLADVTSWYKKTKGVWILRNPK